MVIEQGGQFPSHPPQGNKNPAKVTGKTKTYENPANLTENPVGKDKKEKEIKDEQEKGKRRPNHKLSPKTNTKMTNNDQVWPSRRPHIAEFWNPVLNFLKILSGMKESPGDRSLKNSHV